MRFHLPRAVYGLAVSCLVAGLATGQGDMEGKLKKKLASEFLKKANWSTDYDTVTAKAAKSGEVIFAYFTRSYAP